MMTNSWPNWSCRCQWLVAVSALDYRSRNCCVLIVFSNLTPLCAVFRKSTTQHQGRPHTKANNQRKALKVTLLPVEESGDDDSSSSGSIVCIGVKEVTYIAWKDPQLLADDCSGYDDSSVERGDIEETKQAKNKALTYCYRNRKPVPTIHRSAPKTKKKTKNSMKVPLPCTTAARAPPTGSISALPKDSVTPTKKYNQGHTISPSIVLNNTIWCDDVFAQLAKKNKCEWYYVEIEYI